MPPPAVCLHVMEARHKAAGLGSMGKPVSLFNQNQQQLKEECLQGRLRFIDDTFPPDGRSLGRGILQPDQLASVQWLRPQKISPKPTFVLEGISRFDFSQGELGNCWFLASIGALTFKKNIFEQVVPIQQSFEEDYCGLFYFRFWRFGRWMDVVIDDKLPTINGRLIFVHSKDPNEFWPALMEKAYAKVCGSYADMSAGTPSEAMMDFTGGVHISIGLCEPPSDLFDMLCRAGESSTLMACGTPQDGSSANTVSPSGLVLGHAYTVTGVQQVISCEAVVTLVRLWNPWCEGEWTGDWSDRSPLWDMVSADHRRWLSVQDNGEFWMKIQDFCSLFEDLDICGTSPDFLDKDPRPWKTSSYEGRWVAGTTGGGCIKYTDSFWTNPQYQVHISGEDLETSTEKNLLVSLLRKPDKRNRHLVQNIYVGLSIFQDLSSRGKFPASFFSSHAPVAQTKTYMNAREVIEFIRLKPGHYVIVPSTFSPNETASFLLTIYSKDETHCYENSGDAESDSVEQPLKMKNEEKDNFRLVFDQLSDKFQEVDAERLQTLLNENVLKGDLKCGGFSVDACRSMVALMDTSITGTLNSDEFHHLCNNILRYKDAFFRSDVSGTGKLSLCKLRSALKTSGVTVGDNMLNLMALRYGASSGHMTLESFISLMLRFDCMLNIFQQLSDGDSVTLNQWEWMFISMNT